MSPERCEQCDRKIGIELKILTQFREAQVFGANIGASESKRRFAPVVDLERGIHFFVGDISGRVVVDHFDLLEFPGFRFGVISRA